MSFFPFNPRIPQDPDPDPDPHEDFCPDPDPQKNADPKYCFEINIAANVHSSF